MSVNTPLFKGTKNTLDVQFTPWSSKNLQKQNISFINTALHPHK